LEEENKITQGSGIWKGIRDDNGIELLSNEAIKPFVLDENTVSNLKELQQ
jgi:hypothetical protein